MRYAIAPAALAALLFAAPAACAEDWEFKISPYFWAAGLEGEVGVFRRLPPVSVDESFSDILDQLQFGAMGVVEARKGEFGLVADMIYLDTQTSATIPDRRFTSVGLGTKTFIGTFATVWRLAEAERLDADLVVGTRLYWTEATVDLHRDDGVTLSADPDKMWLNAIVGARGVYDLSPHWSITAYGDAGGVSSNTTWQLYGAANYKVNDLLRLFAGWRYLDVDYENDRFTYDVAENGPMIGATFSF